MEVARTVNVLQISQRNVNSLLHTNGLSYSFHLGIPFRIIRSLDLFKSRWQNTLRTALGFYIKCIRTQWGGHF